MSTKKLLVSFDIGHSSLGWAVLDRKKAAPTPPEILGCGVVTFPADDCLASKRRDFRRQRRNIRATRHRIQRIAKLLAYLKVLSEKELSAKPGHPSPWKLAARVLKGGELLSWEELWNVLRWYAHNRGYDGNARWSKQHNENDKDDTDKEKTANGLMQKHNTNTMAETVCALLNVDPLSEAISSSHLPYKTFEAAFPRKVVLSEVRKILECHRNKLPKLDQKFIDTLMIPEDDKEKPTWKILGEKAGLKLPKRYTGGLLFGQLIPRFDNRIISRCPISGDKVPNKACMDFYRFRWAMILKNLKVSKKPLTSAQRKELNTKMEERGRLTPGELESSLEEIVPEADDTNIDTYFNIHPDSEKALILDPALAYANNPRNAIGPYLAQCSDKIKQQAIQHWKKGRAISLKWLREKLEDASIDYLEFDKRIEKEWKKDQKKKNPAYASRSQFEDQFLNRLFSPDIQKGRAPYSRKIMRQAVDEIMNGYDPERSAKSDKHPTGEKKEKDGVLFRSEKIRQREFDQPIDKLTNNHLIRHRLLILNRLAEDITEKYADGNKKLVNTIVIEVNRDLRDFSGKTQKEIKIELNERLKHFKSAKEYLQDNAPDLPITGGLIRKARIAMDLDWTCPYTGHRYDAQHLPYLRREHIIPRSLRPTDALYAQVLTWHEVNNMKGKRTARQFISEFEGQSVSVQGKSDLQIQTVRKYDDWINKLNKINKQDHLDDKRRKQRRIDLLSITSYEPQAGDFTEGALTQTSHLTRLAARQLEKNFHENRVFSVPGQVTGEVRKAWKLMGCIIPTCPDAEKHIRDKDAIRGLTHLHHAIDAVTLGLTVHYIPNDGNVWEALVKRNKSANEWALLRRLGVFKKNNEGKVQLEDLSKEIKDQVVERISERRVIQHIPTNMSGVKAELNTWGVIEKGDSKDVDTMVKLRQKKRIIKYGKRIRETYTSGKNKGTEKSWETKKKTSKLLGVTPESDTGKLLALKGALIVSENYGIAILDNVKNKKGETYLEVIPYHKVWHRLQNLKKKNKGKSPRILRKGMLIKVPMGKREGTWHVKSTKNNKDGIALDLTTLDGIKLKPKTKNILVKKLLQSNMQILETSYTGIKSKI